MKLKLITSLAFSALLVACGDNGGDTDGTTGTTTAGTATEPTTTGGADGALCVNLGGYAGVQELIGTFAGNLLGDERINAYFLNTDVDAGNLVDCLSKQVGAAAGCSGITYDCLDMKAAHAGMGLSMNDFADLAEDFSLALDTHQTAYPTTTDEDKTAILTLLGGMAPDIVEDATNDATIYQRLGRKPAIHAVIGDGTDPKSFVAVVVGDAEINGFFGAANVPRLQTCLTRQLTDALGGGGLNGHVYGKEVDPPMGVDPGVGAANPCKDMKSSHAALVDDMQVGIAVADFGALAMDLATAMTNFSVAQADQDAILAALTTMCPDIVTVDPGMCP